MDDENLEYISESETLSETFSDIEISKEPAAGKKIKETALVSEKESGIIIEHTREDKNIVIKNEAYYSVYYDDGWYIGRIVSIIDQRRSKIKFLESRFDNFVWPKVDDVQIVDNQFIIHGPVKLLENDSNDCFQISRQDRLGINSRYKEFKNL